MPPPPKSRSVRFVLIERSFDTLLLFSRPASSRTQVDPFVEKQRGFLRDVATAADGNGLLVSDAVAPAESYVQLSDEEILADNPDLARFFEMIEVSTAVLLFR